MKLFLLFVVFLSACAVQKPKNLVKNPEPPSAPRVFNRDLWLKRHSDELLLHPIYASLPLEKRKTTTGIEVMAFNNAGGSVDNEICNINSYYSYDKYSSSGRNSGGCTNTRVEISCNHVFYVKNNTISDYKKVGQCFKDERFDFRPYDEAGLPVMTKEELIYIKELKDYEEKYAVKPDVPQTCERNADCSGGMSCSGHICKNLGLWGKIFNP